LKWNTEWNTDYGFALRLRTNTIISLTLNNFTIQMGLFGLGGPEIAIIGVAAAFLLGPQKVRVNCDSTSFSPRSWTNKCPPFRLFCSSPSSLRTLERLLESSRTSRRSFRRGLRRGRRKAKVRRH